MTRLMSFNLTTRWRSITWNNTSATDDGLMTDGCPSIGSLVMYKYIKQDLKKKIYFIYFNSVGVCLNYVE